jgi:hypothetical protein
MGYHTEMQEIYPNREPLELLFYLLPALRDLCGQQGTSVVRMFLLLIIIANGNKE